jgi:hypothetical protein
VGAKKRKDLEIKLQKMFEINKKFQAIKKRCQAKSDIDHVIRRRKGEPDKLISRMPKKNLISKYLTGCFLYHVWR